MVKWTSKSEEDLDHIRDHIAKNFNIDLAIKTVNGIIDQTESILSSNPLAGIVLESNPLFSKLVLDENSIFYCENPRDRDLYIVYMQARNIKIRFRHLTDKEIV